MDKKVKHEIIIMLIPIIGTWLVIRKTLLDLVKITWWEYSDKAPIVLIILAIYQLMCWLILYYFVHIFK